MRAIEINQELGSVKEKFYGFEMYQILYAGVSGAISLYLNFHLPKSLGAIRGVIASMVTVPLILIAIKDFYGLKGLRLARAVLSSSLSNKPLMFESENIWKGVKRKC
ncbi:MAG: hypothetical protein ILA13_08315 [Eubacterium sp.]|nr:hypothetical protein [Eubacterium sp.]